MGASVCSPVNASVGAARLYRYLARKYAAQSHSEELAEPLEVPFHTVEVTSVNGHRLTPGRSLHIRTHASRPTVEQLPEPRTRSR